MISNKQVMTLANSIIGVSVLAMPFCFKECGMLLSLLLLVSSSILSRLTCYFLLKSAVLTRRRNYEFLAFHVYGPTGKLAVELFIIGFLLGTCVAFFVVMGDLSPQIISNMMGVKRAAALRTTVMFVMALLVVLPLGLLRNVESLEFICTASIGFYLCLVLKVIAESTPHLIGSDWLHEVRLWRPEGVLQCLPIFSMALFCQTQLFEVFGNLPNTPLDKMIEAVRTSINLCTVLYASVGFFGYVAFNSDQLTGNVLMSLEPTISSEVIKIGFVLSVALSFPLVIFPCRASLYSLFYRSQVQPMAHDFAGSHIPDNQFKLLTVSIVIVSLIIGILLPNIETVLGLVGSTIGVTVCITLPAMLMHVIARQEGDRLVSKVTLAIGIIIMVLGTFSHLASIDKAVPLPEKISVNDDFGHLKDFGKVANLESDPLPLSPVLQRADENFAPRPGLPDEKKVIKTKQDLEDRSSAKKVDALPSKEVKPPIDDSSKTLQNPEFMKEIEKNKREQERLLNEHHAILNKLKQHEKRIQDALGMNQPAQNASVVYKPRTSSVEDTPGDKNEIRKVPDFEAKNVPKEVGDKLPVHEDVKSGVVPPETEREQAVPNEIPKEDFKRPVRAEVEKDEELKSKDELPKESLKEPVKSVVSQEEPPKSKEKAPEQSNQIPEQVRLQPPLPLPPQPSKEPPVAAGLAKDTRKSGIFNSDSKKMPPEPIPFVYQKKSSLVEEDHHREKREDRVKCEGNDSTGKKKPSSSLLPDLEPLKVQIEEHIQPHMKDSVL